MTDSSNEHLLLKQDEIIKYILQKLVLTPEQQKTLKLVCKRWKNIIDNIPYLFSLDNSVSKNLPLRNFAMALAPVNSSGDIYHMVTASILAANMGNKIPPIYIAEDENNNHKDNNKNRSDTNTKIQVERAINFASDTGYNGCFFRLHTHRNNSTQPGVRQSQLEVKLGTIGVTHYLDGRVSTYLIAEHVRKFGLDSTTKIVREHFKHALLALPKEEKKFIDDFVAENMEKIKLQYSKSKKPLVIIHYRHSSKANNQQDLSSMAPKITTFLLENNYALMAIYAGADFELKNVGVHVYPFKETRLPHSNKDMGKLCHLALLLKLYEARDALRLNCILGNTSGTLDLAAFIGHKVFNIHNFKGNKCSYQNNRLLCQMLFMTVENAINIEQVNNTYPNKLLANLHAYLQKPEQQVQELSLSKEASNKGMELKGQSLLHSIGKFSGSGYRYHAINELDELTKSIANLRIKNKF